MLIHLNKWAISVLDQLHVCFDLTLSHNERYVAMDVFFDNIKVKWFIWVIIIRDKYQ